MAASQGAPHGFRRITDNFSSIEQVQQALRSEGLESSQLILAIDFTKSNEWTGARSNGGRSLHALGDTLNPYEQVITIIGRTLSTFDDDQLIPCYGFGDSTTGDRRVFSFKDGDQPCNGLEEVQALYRTVSPNVKLSGPTSFAPAIHQAIKVVADSGCQYHILVLVADGQVTRSSDLDRGQLSEQEQATIAAIVEASKWPLSIIMVGVGDGPWDTMRDFDDALPARQFDNFQFCCATDIFARHQRDATPSRMEASFALNALMEVPEQFKTMQRLGLVGRSRAFNLRLPAPLGPPRPRPPPGMPPQAPMHPSAPPAYAPGYPLLHPPAQPPAMGYAVGAPPGVPPQPYPHPYGPSPSFSGGAAYPPPQYGVAGASSSSARVSYGSAQDGFPPVGMPMPDKGLGGSQRVSYERGSAASQGTVSAKTADALFVCPITQEVMQDPVIAADGYSYERSAIEEWLRGRATSPMSNAPLPHKNLIPNHQLRSTIMEWKQQGGGS